MQPCEEELLDRCNIFRVLGCTGRVRHRFYLRLVGLIFQQFHAISSQNNCFHICIGYFRSLEYLCIRSFRSNACNGFFQQYLTGLYSNHLHTYILHLGSRIKNQLAFAFCNRNMQYGILRSILHITYLTIRHEVLFPRFFLIRLQPGKVRLIVGINSRHQLDIRSVFVRQVTVPSLPEITITPSPLLLTRRYMMVGHVQQSCSNMFFVSTHEIKFRTDSHIRCRNRYVLIFRNIHTGRVILLVVHTCSDGERRNITLAMVEHRIYIGRENRVIMVVHHNCRIGPPQECLRECSTVVYFYFDFDIRFSRIQTESLHTFRAEHTFYFAAPYGLAAIGMFLDRTIGRQECRRTMMLGPVKLNTTRNPRTGKSHQRRFHHLIIIYKVTVLHLIVCHVHTSSQFGQYHHFDIFILDKESMV